MYGFESRDFASEIEPSALKLDGPDADSIRLPIPLRIPAAIIPVKRPATMWQRLW